MVPREFAMNSQRRGIIVVHPCGWMSPDKERGLSICEDNEKKIGDSYDIRGLA
jgi:hypothetical protein